jgi:hypothetical protein
MLFATRASGAVGSRVLIVFPMTLAPTICGWGAGAAELGLINLVGVCCVNL